MAYLSVNETKMSRVLWIFKLQRLCLTTWGEYLSYYYLRNTTIEFDGV